MKILIFVSTQSSSKPAVMFGGLIARQNQSSVALLTVIEDAQNLDLAYQTLDKAGLWIPELGVRTSIRIGTEIDGILEEINALPYDLVVLKARQVVQIKDFLKTKIGRRVARQSPISVLVVKQKQLALKRILICTSGVTISDPVVEMGSRLAQATQAKATLLHVTGSIPSMYTGFARMEETLPDLLQTVTPVAQNLHHGAKILTQYQVEAELELRHGSVSEEILREAHLGNYDLIVLGASKASIELTGWLLGDVAQHIVDQAHCPVLVVRQESPS